MYLCPCILVRQIVLFLYVPLSLAILVYQSSFLFVRCILSPSTFSLYHLYPCLLVHFSLCALVFLSACHLFFLSSCSLFPCLQVIFSLSSLYPVSQFSSLSVPCTLVYQSSFLFVLWYSCLYFSSFFPLVPCFLVYQSSFLFVPCILVNQSSFLFVLWYSCLFFLFVLWNSCLFFLFGSDFLVFLSSFLFVPLFLVYYSSFLFVPHSLVLLFTSNKRNRLSCFNDISEKS